MWSGRNKAWNVSCDLASHGQPVPNTSENMKPQCHNENSFIYIIIEYNQHLVGEKRKISPNTQLLSRQTVSWHNQSAAYAFTYDLVTKSKEKKKKTFRGCKYFSRKIKNTVLPFNPVLSYFNPTPPKSFLPQDSPFSKIRRISPFASGYVLSKQCCSCLTAGQTEAETTSLKDKQDWHSGGISALWAQQHLHPSSHFKQHPAQDPYQLNDVSQGTVTRYVLHPHNTHIQHDPQSPN